MDGRSFRRRVLAVLAGLLALALLELAVRAAESIADRPADEFFYGRVFERAGEVYRTREQRRGFFLAQEFPARKAPGALRVFIVGGSTALGFPFEKFYGLTQLLQVALSRLEPGRTVEVIDAAGFGYATNRVAAVAEEVLALQPDALVVMTGHNEFLEQRVGGPRRVALFRLLLGLERKLRGRADTVRWEAHDVRPAERAEVEARFKAALRRLARAARRAGVPTILVTCPSNLKDYRPYGPSAVPGAEQERIDRALAAGSVEAEKLLRPWRDRFPTDAWAAFEQGWVAGETGGVAGGELSRRWWERARDLDPQPVRATGALNRIVRGVAVETGNAPADAEEAFGGAPGNDLFLDHCHPRERGQELLALTVLRALARAGLVGLPAGGEDLVAKEWRAYAAAAPAPSWAGSYYRIAFEAGMNMDRPCRGMRLTEEALRFDPAQEKALRLRERLLPRVEGYCLTGD